MEAEVINLRSVKPMDVECIINSVKKTGHLLAATSDFPFCGIGAEIIATTVEYAYDYLDAPPVRVTGAEVPTPYALGVSSDTFWSDSQLTSYSLRICPSPRSTQSQITPPNY